MSKTSKPVKLDDLDRYQSLAMNTAAVKQKGRVGKTWAGLEFASESLELAAQITSNITKSQFRGKDIDLVRLEDELGDALWTLSAVAYMFDLSLSSIGKKNLLKVNQKHANLKTNIDPSPEKPKNPFPWAKGAKKDITECPSCKGPVAMKEGCVSCISPSCGWSAC